MPVPFEALLPLGIITGLMGVTGVLLNLSKKSRNDGLNPRYNVDTWDRLMMQRDKRLTGLERKQQADIVAPKEFATNSIRYMEYTGAFKSRY
ncbi:small secreted protein [Piptocephalis cylindrospora]|uniref:NADH dehydrogenase [ubiquinone] 1 alpha subcomplex subunit 1 n=1 Tax=Piptocephalis cylindrospora TaxID=1907219 RepID=A0A4V1IYM3_9FUNG|nr:small secreted protein [Piptocephalis cylindrospora]|eukprot:RKP15059.1 small secreted protein [Piptocephalis cylindrospora]